MSFARPLLALLPIIVCGCSVERPPPLVTRSGRPVPAFGQDVAGRLLAAHNVERAAVRVAPLLWDESLATSARAYAAQLVRTGALRHSDRRGRPGQGENLWMGAAGGFKLERMVGSWASERRVFRPGIFPAVSRTGNWADVGHYSQMIWPTTQRLGCGLASARGREALVCRYYPAGNVDGRRVP